MHVQEENINGDRIILLEELTVGLIEGAIRTFHCRRL